MKVNILALLIQTTFYTTITIMVLLLLKKIFQRHLSAKMHCLIWVILCMRLLWPFNLEMPINLYSLFEGIPQMIGGWQEADEGLMITDAKAEIELIFKEHSKDLTVMPRVLNEPMILGFWLAGTGIIFWMLVHVYRKGYKYAASLEKATREEQMLLIEGLSPYVSNSKYSIAFSDKQEAPYVIGIVNPIMVLPKAIFEMDRVLVEHIICHELAHLKQRDLVYRMLYLLLCSVQWFNPLVWIGFSVFCLDQELYCDFRVIRHLSPEKIKAYANSLISYQSQKSLSQGLILGFSRQKHTKRRILMIANNKHTKNYRKIGALVATGIIGLSLLGTSSMAESADKVVDKVEASQEIQWYNPVEKIMVASKYGEHIHPTLKKKKFHTGVDLARPSKEPIFAAAAGEVVYSDFTESYGNMLIVQHADGLQTMYGHCDTLLKKVGDKVESGEKVATIGMTGYSTGPHLHFEVRSNGETLDPMQFIKE